MMTMTQWERELYGHRYEMKHPGSYWKVLSKSRWSLPFIVTEEYRASNLSRKCGSTDLVSQSSSQSCIHAKVELDISGDSSYGMNEYNTNPMSREFGSKYTRCQQLHYSWLVKKKQIIINWILVYPCVAFGFWAIIYILFGEHEAFVGGSLCSLLILEILAMACGTSFTTVIIIRTFIIVMLH